MEIFDPVLSIQVSDTVAVTDAVVQFRVPRLSPQTFRLHLEPVNVKKVHVMAVKGRAPPVSAGRNQSCRNVSVLEAVSNQLQFIRGIV